MPIDYSRPEIIRANAERFRQVQSVFAELRRAALGHPEYAPTSNAYWLKVSGDLDRVLQLYQNKQYAAFDYFAKKLHRDHFARLSRQYKDIRALKAPEAKPPSLRELLKRDSTPVVTDPGFVGGQEWGGSPSGPGLPDEVVATWPDQEAAKTRPDTSHLEHPDVAHESFDQAKYKAEVNNSADPTGEATEPRAGREPEWLDKDEVFSFVNVVFEGLTRIEKAKVAGDLMRQQEAGRPVQMDKKTKRQVKGAFPWRTTGFVGLGLLAAGVIAAIALTPRRKAPAASVSLV